PGLEAAGYLTNETVFNLTELPLRLAVLGAGPVGCELSQAFARFGSKVHLLQSAPRVLARDDAEAGARVEEALRRDGIEVHLSTRVTGVAPGASGKIVRFEREGRAEEIEVDEILVGVGRAPNVGGLGLE